MMQNPEPQPGGAAARQAPGFVRRFLPVWGLGLVGVASLLLREPPARWLASAPSLQGLPDMVVRLLVVVNPLILVTALAALGAALAHRVGLRSQLAGDADARLDARTAVLLGMATAAVLIGVDRAVADPLGSAWKEATAEAAASPWLPTLLLGMLYGGLAEEVMLRWGVMSAVVWAVAGAWTRSATTRVRPSSTAAWLGIGVAATLFAAGHLPALAQSVELSAPVVVRTLALNGLAGLVFGWLFWRRSLESAMLAHASTHLGMVLGRWLGQGLGADA